MKILETAMPQLIHLSPEVIDEAKQDITRQYAQKSLTFIEKYNGADLYFGGNDNNQRWGLFYKHQLVYFVFVKKVQLFNGVVVRQTLVDRNKTFSVSTGVAQHIIFNKLLPKYKALASDCQHSTDGLRLWTNLIGDVLKNKQASLKVSLFNTNDKTEVEIKSIVEMEEHHIWGESSFYQRFIVVISEK